MMIGDKKAWNRIRENIQHWNMPEIPSDIPYGDMPGDKIEIRQGHIAKAKEIFPALLKELKVSIGENREGKAVVTVCGGSGVGKSEIASLLSYMLSQIGVGSYTLSGDNYPRRIPKYNDAERLRLFRESGIRGMVKEDALTQERFEKIRGYQLVGDDANKNHLVVNPWFHTYLEAGRKGLEGYLGTKNEIDFEEIEEIVNQFKVGTEMIWLKRMGREDTELWYEKVDFSEISVLIIEWTHGNSDKYSGVDIPILLNSTPQETLEHRRARSRDGAIDSSFTTMVLEIEQRMLETQANKAKIIVSKSGKLLSFEEYSQLMEA